MGFLIFAYRKLFLKRRINDLQYREMVLQQKKMLATEQIGNYQSIMSYQDNMMQSAFSSQMAQLMMQKQSGADPSSIFQQQWALAQQNQEQKALTQYYEQAQM